MKYAIYLAPLVICAAIGAFLLEGLSGNPRLIPSEFIGKPAPAISLQPLPGRAAGAHADAGPLSNDDLSDGKPVVVNFWASWCVPCVAEHPLIDRLTAIEGMTVHGVNWRDKPADAAAWLAKLGDPYVKVGSDEKNEAGIDWGVAGVPETFVIDGKGVVRFKYAGALTPEIVEQHILPVLREAN